MLNTNFLATFYIFQIVLDLISEKRRKGLTQKQELYFKICLCTQNMFTYGFIGNL